MSKITIDRAVLERVLNAILNAVPQTASQSKEQLESLLALRGALAQPQQEPVAEVSWDGSNHSELHFNFLPAGVDLKSGDKLYTSPQASTATSEDVRLARKPLTVEKVEEVWMAYEKARPKNSSNPESRIQFARAIEAAHGIK